MPECLSMLQDICQPIAGETASSGSVALETLVSPVPHAASLLQLLCRVPPVVSSPSLYSSLQSQDTVDSAPSAVGDETKGILRPSPPTNREEVSHPPRLFHSSFLTSANLVQLLSRVEDQSDRMHHISSQRQHGIGFFCLRSLASRDDTMIAGYLSRGQNEISKTAFVVPYLAGRHT